MERLAQRARVATMPRRYSWSGWVAPPCALAANEFVLSADEKTQIPIRSTSRPVMPPAPQAVTFVRRVN